MSRVGRVQWVMLALLLSPEWSSARTIAKMTDPSEIPGLVTILQGDDEKSRTDAAFKLGRVWPREAAGAAASALIVALNDRSEQVRIHAAAALGDLRAEEAIDPLIGATHDPSAEVAKFAAQSLGQIGPPAARAVPHLWTLLERESDSSHSTVALALGRIKSGQDRAVPVMIDELGSSNKYVRLEAARALGVIGPLSAPAVSALRQSLHDPSWHVGQEACRALRAIGTPEATAALREYTEDCTDVVIRTDKN